MYGAVTLCGPAFLTGSTTNRLCNSMLTLPSELYVPQPLYGIAGRLYHHTGLGSSPFARRY